MSKNQEAVVTSIIAGDLDRLSRVFDEHPEALGERAASSNRTWLHVAADEGQVAMVHRLHNLGIPLDELDSSGESALTAAVRRGLYDTVRWMLEQGVPAACGKPSIPAVSNGNLEMVKLLAEYGDEFQLVFGTPPRTLYDQAVNFGHPEVAAFLAERGVRPLAEHEGVETGGHDEAIEDDELVYLDLIVEDVEAAEAELLAWVAEQMGREPRPLAVREIVPGVVPVAVHTFELEDRLLLVTTGLSTRPLNGPEEYEFVELAIVLPPDWPVPQDLAAPEAWPWRWLRTIGQFVHESDDHLGGPVSTFANGHPPEPLAPGCDFTGFLLLFGEDLETRLTKDERMVHFATCVPLYTEELNLATGPAGPFPLSIRFIEPDVPTIVTPGRKNLAK